MTTQDEERTQINFRLTPGQVSMLVDLTMLYGSRSRAMAVALETLWRDTADRRAALVEDKPAEAETE
jgi:hypothetical protein